MSDQVSSPVHGDIPGVYKHAMALDNLITYGAGYPTRPTRIMELLAALTFYILVEFLSVHLMDRLDHPGRAGWKARFWALGAASAIYLGAIFVFDWPLSLLLLALGYYATSDLIMFIFERRTATRPK